MGCWESGVGSPFIITTEVSTFVLIVVSVNTHGSDLTVSLGRGQTDRQTDTSLRDAMSGDQGDC